MNKTATTATDRAGRGRPPWSVAGLGSAAAPFDAAADAGRGAHDGADPGRPGDRAHHARRGRPITTYGATGAQVQWDAGRCHRGAGRGHHPVDAPRPAPRRRGWRRPAHGLRDVAGLGHVGGRRRATFAKDLDAQGCRTSAQVEAARPAPPRAPRRRRPRPPARSTTRGAMTSRPPRATAASTTTPAWSATATPPTSQLRLAGQQDEGHRVGQGPGRGLRPAQGRRRPARYANERSTAVDWDPYASESIGSCRSTHVSIEGKSGTSYSSSAEVCPDQLSPWASDRLPVLRREVVLQRPGPGRPDPRRGRQLAPADPQAQRRRVPRQRLRLALVELSTKRHQQVLIGTTATTIVLAIVVVVLAVALTATLRRLHA